MHGHAAGLSGAVSLLSCGTVRRVPRRELILQDALHTCKRWGEMGGCSLCLNGGQAAWHSCRHLCMNRGAGGAGQD